MKTAIDSSVIISALCAGDPDHAACRKVLLSRSPTAFTHTFSETFSTLTGGRLGFRIPAADAATILRQQVAPRLAITPLTATDLWQAYEEAEARGVRGGAIYDYLHLVAARKAGAGRIYTLNLADFRSFHRPGDPEIVAP
jgi:predicted nucleic acid-binding protein